MSDGLDSPDQHVHLLADIFNILLECAAMLIMPDISRAVASDLRRLLGLLSEKKLRPIVGARLPLTEAARAHQMLDSASVSGKIVLVSE